MTTFNQKLLQGVQMFHGAVFSKRAPLVKLTADDMAHGRYWLLIVLLE
jgi:hypothetical protein